MVLLHKVEGTQHSVTPLCKKQEKVQETSGSMRQLQIFLWAKTVHQLIYCKRTVGGEEKKLWEPQHFVSSLHQHFNTRKHWFWLVAFARKQYHWIHTVHTACIKPWTKTLLKVLLIYISSIVIHCALFCWRNRLKGRCVCHVSNKTPVHLSCRGYLVLIPAHVPETSRDVWLYPLRPSAHSADDEMGAMPHSGHTGTILNKPLPSIIHQASTTGTLELLFLVFFFFFCPSKPYAVPTTQRYLTL